jgi:hypothetical protein
MRFRKRIDSFSGFECKKMGRTFSSIPIFILHERGLFLLYTLMMQNTNGLGTLLYVDLLFEIINSASGAFEFIF